MEVSMHKYDQYWIMDITVVIEHYYFHVMNLFCGIVMLARSGWSWLILSYLVLSRPCNGTESDMIGYDRICYD